MTFRLRTGWEACNDLMSKYRTAISIVTKHIRKAEDFGRDPARWVALDKVLRQRSKLLDMLKSCFYNTSNLQDEVYKIDSAELTEFYKKVSRQLESLGEDLIKGLSPSTVNSGRRTWAVARKILALSESVAAMIKLAEIVPPEGNFRFPTSTTLEHLLEEEDEDG